MPAPPKYRVLELEVSRTDYAEVCDLVMEAAAANRPYLVAHAPVHLVVAATRDAALRSMLSAFDVVAPDGQPVRWALRLLHGVRLADRVYGPFTMLRLCARAERERVPVFLFGSTGAVLQRLERRLQQRFPALSIAGSIAPPFRPLTDDEAAQVVGAINGSGAGILFVGLGCPKQERSAYEHRHAIRMPQICVGAAFDFLSGTKAMAPAWMQRSGLEWLFRLSCEPRRLWRRYLTTNGYFVLTMLRQWASRDRLKARESGT